MDPNYPKFDPPTSAFTRTYIFVQFWLLTAASLWLLQVEKDLPRTFVLLLFAWMCFSLFVQGVWLEGRAFARKLEWVRIALTLVLAIVAALGWPGSLQQIAFVLAAYSVASAAAMGVERMLSLGATDAGMTKSRERPQKGLSHKRRKRRGANLHPGVRGSWSTQCARLHSDPLTPFCGLSRLLHIFGSGLTLSALAGTDDTAADNQSTRRL